MPKFKWEGTSPSGKAVNGVIEANSKQEAFNYLKNSALT